MGTIIAVAVVGVIVFVGIMISAGARSQKMKNNYYKLRIGMSEDEVLTMFGTPTTVGRNKDGTEVLRWNIDESMIHSAFDKDTTRSVEVVIKDGEVVSYDGHNINKRIWI